MKYYLVFNDEHQNGIVVRQDQIRQLKLKVYDIIIEIDDAAMAIETKRALGN